mgnify:CR=1 FL=1
MVMLTLAACGRDETLTAFVPDGVSWQLSEITGAEAPPQARLTFPRARRLVLRTPCGRTAARIAAPYPWFELSGPLRRDRPCKKGAGGGPALSTLARMTLAEVAGETLILSTPGGAAMVFTAQP